MKFFKSSLHILLILSSINSVFAQTTQKKIEKNAYSWVSINSNFYINTHWFVIADLHMREKKFFASNSFWFGRIGLGYQVNKNLSVAAGYGNLLASPIIPGYDVKADEDRIYQQVQLSSSYPKLKMLQRLRNEQRWQQIVVNDVNTGKNKFSNRVRYLLSFTYQPFKKASLPQFVLANELMLQFGKDIVMNTFEQNRIFLGIKQNINKNLTFDIGYMNIFQQRSSGLSYSKSDVFRLFFYYNLPASSKANSKLEK